MNMSMEGADFIKSFERLRLVAYTDLGGVWTIGWGHTGRDVFKGLKIDSWQAGQLFIKDTKVVEYVLNTFVKVALNQNEYDALASLVFNIGGPKFATSTLLKKLNAGDKAGAAKQILRWVKVDGLVVKGLVRRREAEYVTFFRPAK